MGAVLSLALPVILEAVENGTAIKIVQTAAELLQLLIPIVADPKVQAGLKDALANLQIGPAQPENPAMQHATGHNSGR